MSDPAHAPDDVELDRALALLERPDLEAPVSELELLAGEALLGWVGEAPPLSPRLERLLLADADAFFDPPAAAEAPAAATPPAAGAHGGLSAAGWGWLAAALLLLSLGVGRWQASEPVALEPTSLPQQVAQDPDRLQLPFAATPDGEADFAGVEGEVVWSPAQQRGYMTFRGLPKNVPSQRQYQLWIVDPTRDQHPVDGGVFDVDAEGEVVIPIDAKLRIDEPRAFAITLEQPGGVVVSGGPLLLVAAP